MPVPRQMGPRGHRLHCTKKHLRVLTLACPTKEIQGKKYQDWEVEKYQKTKRRFPLSVCCQVLPARRPSRSTGDGQREQAARKTGQSNKNSAIPFSTTMQSLTVCSSLCISSCVLRLFTRPHVCVVFVLCCCALCEKGPECNIQKDLNLGKKKKKKQFSLDNFLKFKSCFVMICVYNKKQGGVRR